MPTMECTKKQATIRNISMKSALAEEEIRWQLDENNQLKQKMIAQQILLRKLGKKGLEPSKDK
jgi:hypothetical protein